MKIPPSALKLVLLESTWKTEQELQWNNSRAKIPPHLYPAQQQIYELVKRKQHQHFVTVVSLLQQIALNKVTRPPGLHLTMISLFRETKHQHEHLQHIKNEASLITEFKDYGRLDEQMADADDILDEIQDD